MRREIVNDSYFYFFFFFFFESLLTSFDSLPTSFESFSTAVVIVVTCDVRSPELCGELDPFDGWSFGRPGTCLAVGHNVDATVKSVDLLGQLTEADQTENGNVLEESHAVGGRRLGYPGLFHDRLDLVLGTDSLGHPRYRRPGSPCSARVSIRPPCGGSVAERVLVDHVPTPTLFVADEPLEHPGRRSRAGGDVSGDLPRRGGREQRHELTLSYPRPQPR